MKNNLEMERIKDRQKLSAQGMFYSIQRMDLLIVSISGAGIYVCLETLKYINDNNLLSSNLIKWSGGILLFSIVVNFISQFLGHKSNYYDYLMCDTKLDAGEKVSQENQIIIDKYDYNSNCYDKATTIFNGASAFSMFVGLTLLMTYFVITF
ncbi:MAG: hypothetical protein Q8Q51_03660 [Lutibacter sp.]|nr:hypothetical protein [Lutibacter sp.]